MKYAPRPDVLHCRKPLSPGRDLPRWFLRLAMLACGAFVLAGIMFGRTATFANGDTFTVNVRIGYDNSGTPDTIDYPVPGGQTLSFPIPDSAASAQLVNFSTGSTMTGTFAVPASGDFVIDNYNSLKATAVTGPGGGGGTVHVDNPTQGMEFVLVALGFICAAVAWRFLLGRW